MLLRPRQVEFVDRFCAALTEHGNTLGVASTGFGKTIAMASIVEKTIGKDGRAMIIAHRDELTEQNRAKFRKVVPHMSTGVVNAKEKQWDRQVQFSMIQTLSRDKNLECMKWSPPDLVLIDESHRGAADSYVKVIDAARAINPKVKIGGVTATPARADSKSLRKVFTNICDQVTLSELIRSGNLVPVRCFVIDIGTQDDLRHVKKTVSDFDMGQVAQIMDKAPLTERVVEEWRKVAADRRTVVFASTVEHAKHVAETFSAAGVKAEPVWGDMFDTDRARILAQFDRGEIQVVVNCALLGEGWDCQPVSCVILLRPSSHRSTFQQMVGRTLRTVDPELYPGIVKENALCLDFGTSVLTHGSLEQEARLGHGEIHKHDAPLKLCPECQALVPAGCFECGFCGFVFIVMDDVTGMPREMLTDFVLSEVDILNSSPFRWEEIHDGLVSVADAFDAWGMCVFFGGVWNALGGNKQDGIRLLQKGERLLCLAAADDFLREHGDAVAARKSKAWLKSAATAKQLAYLGLPVGHFGLTKYRAGCYLTFRFQERGIRRKLMDSSVAPAVSKV